MFTPFFSMDRVVSFFSAYGIIFILNLVFSVIIIFAEKRKPTSTLLWVMAINFLPIIGFILYLILGQDLSKIKIFDKKEKIEKKMYYIARNQIARLEREVEKGESIYGYLDMIHMFNMGENEIMYSNNQIERFIDGESYFKTLIDDIKAAKTSIYIQSYIFKSDNLGTEIINLLKEKAKQGLEVILLVDGMGGRKFKSRDRRELLETGAKVEVFFPGIFKNINTRINYRNHRKIIVIDHKIGYVGGYNIGDEYISKSKKFGFWRDTHLRIVGDAIRGLEFRFYLDYKFASGKRASMAPMTFIKTEKDLEAKGSEVCIVTSGPDTKVDSVRNGYEKLITKAKKRIFIQTPYFVPDEGLFKSLKVAALSGVEVNIMIPRIRDHIFVHWASLSFIGELLYWGCKAYYYEGGFLHNKIVISDDVVSSVGTANFDIRSFELNFEVNAFIFDRDMNAKLVEDFYRDVESSTEITLEDYKNRPWHIKVREGFSRLLSPIL